MIIRIFEAKRRGRRENDVAPLRAIYAANSLRAAFVCLVRGPGIWAVHGTHAQSKASRNQWILRQFISVCVHFPSKLREKERERNWGGRQVVMEKGAKGGIFIYLFKKRRGLIVKVSKVEDVGN